MAKGLASLLDARYGPDGPEMPETVSQANPVLHTLLSHRSVRHYAPIPLPPGTVEMLGAAAQSASSSSNLQAWSAVALQDPAHKAEAARICGDQEFIRQAPLFLVFCADLSRLTRVSTEEGLPGDGLDYTEMFVTAVIDAALAGQNTAVAAEGMGLATCYAGAARNRPRELAALLHLPPRVIGLFGLAVGYAAPDDTAAIKPRLPQPTLWHREVYAIENEPGAIESYNETMRGFYQSQQMAVRGDWSRHSAKRVAGPESLSGRHILREILEERGFGLK